MTPLKLPLRITRHASSFAVRDGSGMALAYVYFEDDPTRAVITQQMPEADAMLMAQRIARALSKTEDG
jgi:hypothetical protein